MTGKISILLAEDDRMSAYATKDWLELHGWEVEWANDGKKAWILYQRRKPDVLLLDLDMPKKDGLELIRTLRAEDQSTPIVLYSGKMSTEKEIEALQAGANDVINKGVDPRILLARIQTAYERCRITGGSPHLYQLSARTTFNSVNRVLRIAGQEAVLTEKEGTCLHSLCAQEGQSVSPDFLIQQIWGKASLNKEHALQNVVSSVRRKLRADKSIVLLLRDGGYVLTKEHPTT